MRFMKSFFVVSALAFVCGSAHARFLSVDPVKTDQRDGANFNRYWYGNNNPYKFVDPDGREVKLQWHPVVGSANHTLVRITPENQAAYSNDARFNNVDESGRRYATLGAGPEGGRLVSNVNRESDAAPHTGGIKIDTPASFQSEDQFISALFEADSNYGDNLDYDLFPAAEGKGSYFVADDGYNSNSYVSGLLGATGADAPQPPVTTPGYDKPVPEKEFKPDPKK